LKRAISEKNDFMVSYLIEFRFQSRKIKSYLKEMIYEINHKFKVGKRRPVPHITLVGPIETNNELRLICDFARICSQTKLLSFQGEGFGTFDNNRVIFVKIIPNDNFNLLRVKLSKTLKEYCKLPSHNKKEEKEGFGYHSTLAMKLSIDEFNLIKNYILKKQAPNFSQIVTRVTLLKNGKILREYDFFQKRLLNRRQALDKNLTRRTLELLREFKHSKKNIIKPKKEPLLKRIISIFIPK